jgi:glycosyltransferase involved in cell wall biosynthesis
MKIIFLVPYPLKESPSQRFRFEQYFDLLQKRGHAYDTQSFLDSQTWQLFSKPGKLSTKLNALLKGFLKRFLVLFQISKYNFIFIHREITPIGPPIFEWVIGKILKKKIIYDFDDAIWLTDRKKEPALLRVFKWRSKVKNICRWSYKVSCGNRYLCDFALQYNMNVFLNPTTIDTELLHNPVLYSKHNHNGVSIGWTGSYSTLKYLEQIEDVLMDIEKKYTHVTFIIIADRKPELKLKSLVFKKWSTETEISDLYQFDIGIMPLPDDEWAQGKCGFKALQYMAMNIATIASPVGVNTTIIEHNRNGFLATTSEAWLNYIEQLILNKELRKKLGENGRTQVIENYSVKSNADNFLALFA